MLVGHSSNQNSVLYCFWYNDICWVLIGASLSTVQAAFYEPYVLLRFGQGRYKPICTPLSRVADVRFSIPVEHDLSSREKTWSGVASWFGASWLRSYSNLSQLVSLLSPSKEILLSPLLLHCPFLQLHIQRHFCCGPPYLRPFLPLLRSFWRQSRGATLGNNWRIALHFRLNRFMHSFQLIVSSNDQIVL